MRGPHEARKPPEGGSVRRVPKGASGGKHLNVVASVLKQQWRQYQVDLDGHGAWSNTDGAERSALLAVAKLKLDERYDCPV